MKIDIGIDKVDKIFHLADIHIRTLRRHKEYKQVFERTYKSIKSQLTPNSVIYVAGDIVHSKLDLSPECVDLTADFLRSLADIAPTLVIAGNHDCNLNNTSRQDSIEPIVRALDHKNLHYLKYSGIYRIAGIDWVVMSVWDDPNNFIKAEDVEGNFKIALHHGAVNKSSNDIGYVITNDHVTIERFKGYDLTLLGDIHKYQYLNEAKTIHYPGSLIQQNHGERLSHGYTVWELPSKTSTYVEVPNDYGYVTINVNKGKIVENTTIPNKPRIRLKIEDTNAADVKKLLSVVKQKYKVQDVSLQRINNTQTSEDGETKISLGDIRDVEYQNDLIVKYIESKHPDVDEKILDHIRHINRTTNSKISQNQNVRNITWKPKCFEFNNMFSYGENNKIDFTSMQGTYGLFAPNASGKSAMLDALTYCIFDKCSRSTKGTHVLNNKKNSYWCKFNFEIKGINYYIERTGTRQKNTTVKVIVDFYRIVDGQRESLNGEARDDTNKEIRKYLGQYDDFILTALSLQNNNTGFIDMKQSQRKDLLSKFLDIGIFEDLYQIAAEEISEVSVLLKKLKREDFSTKLAENETELNTSESELNELNTKNTENDKLIESLNKDYTDSLQEFKTVTTTATDIDELKLQLNNFLENESVLQEEIERQKEILEAQQNQLNQLHQVYPEFKETIIDDYNKLVELEGLLENVNDEIDKLEVTIQHKEDKLEKLEEHEYDPNCEYCVNNVFVKDAEETKKQLKRDALVMSTKLGEQERLWEQIKELPNAKKKYEGLLELDGMIETQSNNITNTNKEIETLTTKLESTQKDVQSTQRDIHLYKENEQAIKHNKQHQKVVDEKKSLLDSAKTTKSGLNSRIIAKTGEVSVYKKTKQDIIDKIDELSQLETQYQAYEKYLSAVKRDGVPYTLITTALPRIEQEVNNILTQMTDFTIMFQTDGKNINAYIVYDDKNFWLLELTSGMEKFISSLAIRNALISVSNLPRPNFLAIDEGLGNLDAGMLSQMFLMLDYLKSQYDFLIMISHIDATRDMVDHQININKTKEFSQISYS
jgi:DNA repair exonuclease SbcCD ATPase subunit/3',5'-cyclic AMP phosphodiesterase CpdA